MNTISQKPMKGISAIFGHLCILGSHIDLRSKGQRLRSLPAVTEKPNEYNILVTVRVNFMQIRSHVPGSGDILVWFSGERSRSQQAEE